MYSDSAQFSARGSGPTTALEIVLDRTGDRLFSAQFRMIKPGSATDDQATVSALPIVPLEVLGKDGQLERMGQRLSQMFFQPKVRERFELARASAPNLRVRLSFGAHASDLQRLPWEYLRDPNDESLLLTQHQNVFFSRYLTSFDWSSVPLRPRSELQVVALLANPDGQDYGLAPVPVEQELLRLKEAVRGPRPVRALCTVQGKPVHGKATLERLMLELSNGCDILYLVCHGRSADDRTVLFFETEEGQVDLIDGDVLMQRLSQLAHKPRLVILASCDSAGHERTRSNLGPESSAPLLALGPRLAQAGVPAVLAMHGQVQQETIKTFMPHFFRELLKDGEVDRAVAVARGHVTPEEAGRPVLFSRLTHGRFWYERGFANRGEEEGYWEALRSSLENQSCTPIIGPGLLQTVMDYQTELARVWAHKNAFPLSPRDQENLSVVAQFLSVRHGEPYPRAELAKELLAILKQKWPKLEEPDLPKDLPRGLKPSELNSQRLVGLLNKLREARFDGKPDPYVHLANLNAPIYVMAAPDPLLVEALRKNKKKKKFPREGLLPWRKMPGYPDLPSDPTQKDPSYVPSVEEPLVYYLFGTIRKFNSVLISQDDYMDFLLNFCRPDVYERIPAELKAALNENTLLYLGLPLESNEFRTAFRLIESGLARTKEPLKNVAAQLEPEAGRVLDPVRTQHYFTEYLKRSHVSVYWGPLEAFLEDLHRRTSPDKGEMS